MKRTDFSSDLPMSDDEVTRTIENGLAGLDASRAQGYGQLAQLRDAKAHGLSREQRLLVAKHGNDRHPRIAIAQARFDVNEQFRREIAVVRETVETPLPELDAESMIVHGFVRRRSDQTGVASLTLALSDKDDTWVREFGYACTDARGYFLLKFSPPGEPQLGTANDPLPPKRAAAPRTLSLRVFDREGRVLHTESRAALLAAGTIDYRLILLDDKAADCGCTPPPPSTGGHPVPGRKAPSRPPTSARPAPAAATPQRVSGLKPYEQPSRDKLAGTPLEAMRGIGPKTAGRLGKAGIENVEGYSKTRGEKLIEVAGFDKTQPKKPRTKKTVKPPKAAKTRAKAKPTKPAAQKPRRRK